MSDTNPACRPDGDRVVAASSANLGPGFDSLGLALSLYDEIVVETTESGLNVEVEGQGAGQVPLDSTHLVVRAISTDSRLWRDGRRSECPVSQCNPAFARTGLVCGSRGRRSGRRQRPCRPGWSGSDVGSRSGPALVGVRGASRQRRRRRHGWRRGVLDATGATGPRYAAAPLRMHPDIHLFSAIPEQRSLTAETRVLLPRSVSHARRTVQREPGRAACRCPHRTPRPADGGYRGRTASAAPRDRDESVGGISANVAALWHCSGAVRGRTCGFSLERTAGTSG